mgnify:CR=1 FL=1
MTSMQKVAVSIRVGRYRGPGDESAYRRAKLARIVGAQAPDEAWHDRFIAERGEPLPLADPAREETFSNAARSALAMRKGCALATTLSGYDLLSDGETVESSHFSYLTEDVGENPAGTAVFVQQKIGRAHV